MSDLRIKSILVAVDLGESCVPALHYTRSLAQRFGAAVTVVYADDALTLQSYDELVAGCAIDPEESNALAEAVRRFAAPHLERIRFTVAVSADDPAHAILAHGQTVGADLIVMGTHSRRGVARILGGSVAEAVMKMADRPVVAVPYAAGPQSADGPTITRIICPVDDTKAAHDAARLAAALAEMFAADLHLVNTSGEENIGRFDEDLRSDSGKPAKCTMSRLDTRHDPAGRVLDCVHNFGADLLVIGATRKKNRAQSIVGKTTQRLIRDGHMPVMKVVH